MSIEFTNLRHTIPQTPGVYFFRNAQKRMLYIGKAANLRARLTSYYVKNAPLETAKRRMLSEAKTITWQETNSEIEALILEAFLIKKHLPPYNIVMRDDKQYLFVGFTKEVFPHVFFTHQPIAFAKMKNKTEFFGPFTESGSVKKLLRSLRKVFLYCTCKTPHIRRCQQNELGLCFGFCCLKNYKPTKNDRIAYQKNIRFLKNLLAGKQKQLLSRLQVDMLQTSKKLDFETAARLRDQIRALEQIFAHRTVIKKDYAIENQKGLHELKLLLGLRGYPQRIEGYDISNIQGTYAVGSMVVFTDGIADKQEYRKFKIKTVKGANDPAMMREILTRRLAHTEWQFPDIILIDGGKPQLNAALAAHRASAAKNKSFAIISIAKREEELYVPERKHPFKLKEMPTALLYLLQQIRNEAHRFAISYYRKRHRKEMRSH
ncbi:MAG: hypothetical protein G01um101429_917 [Parcubacteria group bacterium Gr01-1014_29]|nr:MAG: hypothetical protein G01um101429_917 [Parcubacteria group bacterium Gr01-1014_29]